METVQDYSFVIPKGKNSPTIKRPIFHSGFWIDAMVKIDCNLLGPYTTLYDVIDEQKKNTDIQKLFGYTLDPFKLSVIRLGFNNGWAPRNSRYDGYQLSLYAYLTKNGKRYTDQRYGKFFIGTVNYQKPFSVHHQLTSEGFPFFAIFQSGYCNGAKMFEVPYDNLGMGYNMNPYVEYDKSGAPDIMAGSLKFTRQTALSDAQILELISTVK
jgi:hypothetical protein